jgi:hypothetical protein
MISSLIESVMNPNGRFKTLDKIYPIVGCNGEALFNVSPEGVDFFAIYHNDMCILKCILNERSKKRCHRISMFLRHIDSDYIAPALYLEREMAVFDRYGRSDYVDVILQKSPIGISLQEFIDKRTLNKDLNAIVNVIAGLGGMAKWMDELDFSHGDIHADHVLITTSSRPVLKRYAKVSRKRPVSDIKAIAGLAAAVYISACDPALYLNVIRDYLSSTPLLLNFMQALSDALCNEKGDALTDLAKTVCSEDTSPVDICRKITSLAWQVPHPYPMLASALQYTEDSQIPFVLPWRQPNLLVVDRELYTFIGIIHYGRVRVFDGKEWKYLDETGKAVISDKLINADDFRHWRAVVEKQEGFGLIDINGNYVIEPIYDDLDWDSAYDIAIITHNDKSGLASPSGEHITGLIYDQIVNGTEGLLIVKQNDKFGYMRPDGSMATEMIYDDAFGFREGRAMVRKDGRMFYIDLNGNIAL